MEASQTVVAHGRCECTFIELTCSRLILQMFSVVKLMIEGSASDSSSPVLIPRGRGGGEEGKTAKN